MSPHSSYIWHPLHCKWHRIHSITPNNAIYDVTSTSRITSHPCIRHCTHCIFVITTSTLISHPLLNDITPTFCVTSYALYRTSHPIILSSLYCTYDITTSIYEAHTVYRATYTLHMRHHSHYVYDIIGTTSDITFHNLGHQVHFMYDIRSTLSDLTSTVSLSSHHLHWHLTHFCMTSTHLLCDIIWTI